MIKIAIDMMGGDNGVEPLFYGVCEALKNRDFHAVLVGDKMIIEPLVLKISKNLSEKITIEHTTNYIQMDQNATHALKDKTTSIYKTIDLHKTNEVQGVVSAGHSGATMSLATLRIGRVKGILRPAIAAVMPTITSNQSLVLDVGANTDCKSEHLYQFYFMGKEYCKDVMGIQNPRIGLLSNGEEDSKGNEITKEAYLMLKDKDCFIGNVEGNNIFDGSVDVIICDGFIGNIALKSSEGVASAIKTLVKKEIKNASWIKKGVALMLKGIAKNIGNKVDYAEYGGAPLIGIDGCVIIAHGKSNEKAMKNAIFQALDYLSSNINKDLKVYFQD